MKEEITQKKLKLYHRIFSKRYRMKEHDAWDCVTILLQKAKWKAYSFSNQMIHYAYVDYLRERYGRRDRKNGNTKLADHRMSIETHEQLDYEGDFTYSPDRFLERLIRVIVKYGDRRKIGSKKKISVRRVLFKYNIGWAMTEIGKYCGLSESRISQIVKEESNRLYKLHIWN